jgi:predicted dehydrogenase
MSAADKAGTVFMVAEQSQYSPFAVKVQELIRDGAIGEIITARATLTERIHHATPDEFWRYDKEITGGGFVIDGGLHWIRPLRMWFGEVEEVVAVLGHPIEHIEGESMAQALFRFRSGTVANFEGITVERLNAPSEHFRVVGKEGIIIVEKGRRGRTRLYTKDHPDGLDILSGEESRGVAYGLELADFARAVLEGEELAAGPGESVADLRVVWAMYRSAETGQWERVWD